MMKKEAGKILKSMVTKNIPFVLFREPGKKAKLVIQNSPLESTENFEIDKAGFYVFPFSSREHARPLFFAPDHVLDYLDSEHYNIDLKDLAPSFKNKQNLYEVDQDEYISDLNTYLHAFENQGIKKAIYSRISQEEVEDEINLDLFFQELERTYPKAFVYVMNIPGDGIWSGASPELLLSYQNEKAKTVALAGTLRIDNKKSSPEWTRKEIDEHRLVEKYIIALCKEMDLEYEKSQVRTSSTGKVYHLKSDFELSVPSNKIRAFLEKLHPTPAISGLPQDKALDLIYKTEKHDRSYYCGFLGYVEDQSNFNLFINLRCMKVVEDRCYLFAGGGITPESNIDSEWEETNVKMSTLTDLLQKDANYEEVSTISY